MKDRGHNSYDDSCDCNIMKYTRLLRKVRSTQDGAELPMTAASASKAPERSRGCNMRSQQRRQTTGAYNNGYVVQYKWHKQPQSADCSSHVDGTVATLSASSRVDRLQQRRGHNQHCVTQHVCWAGGLGQHVTYVLALSACPTPNPTACNSQI
jgi:hypothetical protein